MKSVFSLKEPDVQKRAEALSTLKICMYFLNKARTEGRMMNAASAFVKAGFSVTIVDVESEHTRPTEEDIRGIHMKHMIIPNWFTSRRIELWFFFIAVRTFILSMRKLLEVPADIYHASELTALPACYVVSRLRRKPLIYEAHELHFPLPETSVSFWRPLGGILIHLLTLILPRCAGVIVVSAPIGLEMQRRYHISEVSVIRNVPPYKAVPKSNLLRQFLGLDPGVRIALYQGGLQRNRGLDKLINAAKFLEPNIVIVMMGQDTEKIQVQLEALIASERVSDRVKIIPPVPYEELLNWTASADIGLTLLPPDYSLSIRLCLPQKFFEYLMAGLPVLSSQLDAIAEVVNSYNVGQIISSLEPKEISVAINRILVDSEALQHMRQNALDVAKQEFNWERESQHLIELIQKIQIMREKANEEQT